MGGILIGDGCTSGNIMDVVILGNFYCRTGRAHNLMEMLVFKRRIVIFNKVKMVSIRQANRFPGNPRNPVTVFMDSFRAKNKLMNMKLHKQTPFILLYVNKLFFAFIFSDVMVCNNGI